MNSILRMEWRKLWIKRRVWLYVSVFGLFLVLSWQLSIMDLYQQDPRDDFYFQYLERVEGQLTDEKEHFLETEAASLDADGKALEQLYSDYYDNHIDDETFREQETQLLQRVAAGNGFQQIFKQYMYARENKDNRFILDDRAWNILLGSVNMDYLLLLIILIITVPIFIQDYEQGMSSLNHSTRLGSRKLVENKLSLCLSMTIILCGVFYFLRLLYFNTMCGLEHGGYPIQSLEAFATSGKDVSILGAYVLISSLKSLAFVSYSLLLALFSILLKKYAPTLLCGFGVILLPQFILEKSPLFYILAFPSGFMFAEGFFYGNQPDIDPFTGKEILIRAEIPTIYIYLTMGIYLIASLSIYFGVRYLESNVLVRPKWPPVMHMQLKLSKLVSLLLLFSLLFPLTACHNNKPYPGNDSRNEQILYNKTDKDVRAGKYDFFFQDPGGGKSMRIMKKDLNTGAESRVDFDPTLRLDPEVNHLFSDGRSLYVTVPSSTKLNGTTTNHSIGKRVKPSINYLSIYAIDLATNQARLIFEKNIDVESFVFFSSYAIKSPLSTELAFLQGADIWLNDDFIFFSTDVIWQYNRKTEHLQKLEIPLYRRNVAFDGERIHFIDDRFRLSVYDPISGSYTNNPDQIVLDFILRPEGLYYLNRKDGNRLYFQPEGSDSSQCIMDEPTIAIWQDKGDIYYLDKDDYMEKALPENLYPQTSS